jgi:ribosomal protein L7Ae-like RNA K-turn-binding protein
LAGKAFGRGAWVHPSPACLEKAAPRGLSRSFRSEVTTSATELWLSLRAAADRRIEGLLGAADRAGRLAVGSTAAREAFESGRAQLVLVATDARAAADAAWVYEAVRRGLGLAWGKKAALGHALRHEEVAVAAVLDEGIAQVLGFVVGVAGLPPPAASPNHVLADSSTEDG